jgi:hypothetical protein
MSDFSVIKTHFPLSCDLSVIKTHLSRELASNALHAIASRGRGIGRRSQFRDEP